jgi:hypothetical protein
MTLNNTCENCESKYKIVFNQEDCPDDPKYCPFCAEYITEETETDEDC